MPGLIGVVNGNGGSAAREVRDAVSCIVYHKDNRPDPLYEDTHITASKVRINPADREESPYTKGGLFCWVDGEAYNLSDFSAIYDIDNGTLPSLLISAYSAGRLQEILCRIDGYFAAVIYDRNRLQLHVISDRYGLKPLYIWSEGEHFGWCTELKGFLSFEAFSPRIHQGALECFINIGHLMGNITWFDHVELLDPSTILSFSIKDKKVFSRSRYWKWSAIKLQNMEFADAVHILGDLLQGSVRKRMDTSSRFGVSLSGGLDSRAILASVEDVSNVVAYTFGKKDCADMRIASRVAGLKKVRHLRRKLNSGNWRDKRFAGVWKTDGMLNFMHMHDTSVFDSFAEAANIHISGFLGDALIGGLYLHGDAHNCRINRELAFKYFSVAYKDLTVENFDNYIRHSDLSDDFFDMDHMDVYIFQNRSRRFTNNGLILVAKRMLQRLPFLDNRLIEFIYSLPDEYRVDSKLYNAALLLKFPQYYQNISWQKTGRPISHKKRWYDFVPRDFNRVCRKLGLKKIDSYVDYKSWMNDGETWEFFTKFLDPQKAIYPSYLDEGFFNKFSGKYLQPYFHGEAVYTEQLGLIIAAEAWFQQVFNNKFRDA